MTQDELKALFLYDPETGIFTRKKWRSSNAVMGAAAGTTHTKGYIAIWIGGRRHMAHRLAWLYVYGEWPTKQIDHINGKKDDNRISNLRLADNAENQQNINTPRTNKSGVKGVFWNRFVNKWHAQIGIEGRNKHIGLYERFEDAVEARRQAEIENHPFSRALIPSASHSADNDPQQD